MIGVMVFSGVGFNVFGSEEPFSVRERVAQMGIQNYSEDVEHNRQELQDLFKQAKRFYRSESTTTTIDSDGRECITVNTRLIDIPVTDEKKRVILGSLAIDSFLRNHRDEQDQQTQLVHEKFGDQPVLRNRYLVLLLGDVCHKQTYGEQTSLQIARAINACNTAVTNHISTTELLVRLEQEIQQLPEQERDQALRQAMQTEPHSLSRPLMNAAQSNFAPMCQLLIGLGVDVHFEDNKRTCLHTALNRKSLEIFSLFYNAGLHYAKQGEELSATLHRYRRHAPQIHQHCLEQGIIQEADQPMDIEQ